MELISPQVVLQLYLFPIHTQAIEYYRQPEGFHHLQHQHSLQHKLWRFAPFVGSPWDKMRLFHDLYVQ
jgi:hypothetical protein